MIKSPYKVNLLSFFIALSFWVIDAYLDSLFHYDESFIYLLFSNEKELYFRSLYSAGILLFGIIMSVVVASKNRAENALMEEKAKTEAIIHSIGDGISILDTDYRMLYQNELHKEFVGNQLGEFCYKAYHKRDNVCESCPVTMTLMDGKRHKAERNITTEKGLSHYEVVSSPLKDSTGKIKAVIESVRDISELKKAEEEREKLILKLKDALDNIKILKGLLPICAYCKKIRDDKGYWNLIETYIMKHTDALFSHGICPECEEKAYEDLEKFKKGK